MKNSFLHILFFKLSLVLVAQNPIITHKYTADPTARVFNGKLYLYTSHDRDDAKYFDMVDWACFSTDDMTNWQDHGSIFSLEDVSWAKEMAWAPDCIERNGKYYFYYPVERMQIGVAVSESPEGPFVDPLKKPLVDGFTESFAGREAIDPTVLIDDDGQAYMYFGCRDARVTKLKENMIEREGELQEFKIFDKEGNRLLWKKKADNAPRLQEYYGGDGVYGEGPFILKRNGIYYLIYANGWAKDATMVYATSNNPMGPFTYQGMVMLPVGAGTSHGSIVEFKGQWYVFYHTKAISGSNYQRSVCIEKITFDEAGKIVPVKPTNEGIGKITMHINKDDK